MLYPLSHECKHFFKLFSYPLALSTGGLVQGRPMKTQLPDEVLDYFKKHGSEGGKKGRKARMSKTTKKQRKAAAKAAAEARWKGHKKKRGKKH